MNLLPRAETSVDFLRDSGRAYRQTFPLQIEELKAGTIPSVKHISFAGSEGRAHDVLSSPGFSDTSRHSLTSIAGLSFQDDLGYLERCASAT